MPVCSLFAPLKPQPAPPVIAPTDRKWNPGNYIASTTTNTGSIWGAFKNRLAARPEWKGVVLRYDWTQLERGEGEYTWTEGGVGKGLLDVDLRLNELQTSLASRKLIILLQMKTFNSATETKHAVPAYMRTAAYSHPYGNGEYHFTSSNGDIYGGEISAMWLTAVRARFQALMNAIATRYDNTALGEHLEAVILNELAVTKPSSLGTAAWPEEDNWYASYKTALANIKPNFARTQIMQWVNSPRSIMQGFVPDIRATGIGLGMTDLCFRDEGFWLNPTDNPSTGPGNIWHCRNSNGLAAISGHVSNPALEGSVANMNQIGEAAPSGSVYTLQTGFTSYPTYNKTLRDTGGGTPYQTKQFIRDMSVDYVGVTHLLWAHSTDPDLGGGGNMAQTVDAWIGNAANNRTTVSDRPTGW